MNDSILKGRADHQRENMNEDFTSLHERVMSSPAAGDTETCRRQAAEGLPPRNALNPRPGVACHAKWEPLPPARQLSDRNWGSLSTGREPGMLQATPAGGDPSQACSGPGGVPSGGSRVTSSVGLRRTC